ncbi:hypothetical protein ALQ78_101748 [Pseudomonas syringae pv. aptata]|jgi:hypothetical protein|nr:Unknown protein sequence [Pseudomonas syringae pv. syringae]KPY34688.1 hypothetical protein ALO65_102315 [Pseudomonas syringae pv. papulans]RMM45930.1 hypothetical protein ALQ78_101748 [Pseudomonas syringae pv. aptata]RMS21053.1 hypothetical protein ALP69_102235 [Pseudomonas syringae pv. aceris]RMN48238.1 hypothetical protein ALQ60_102192 [Pseudomonas syringae pv. papulans]
MMIALLFFARPLKVEPKSRRAFLCLTIQLDCLQPTQWHNHALRAHRGE